MIDAHGSRTLRVFRGRTVLSRFLRDERGATAIEYCFIAMLISVAAVGAMTTIGTGVNTKFQGVIPGFR